MAKTVHEINEKIRTGNAVILTAEEIIGDRMGVWGDMELTML